MDGLTVAAAMRPLPQPLAPDTLLAALAERFTAQPDYDALPVVGPDGTLHGVVSAREVEQAAAGDATAATAADLAQTVRPLAASQPLDRAMAELVHHDGGGLPVVETAGGQVTGWLSHRDVLVAYTHTLEAAQT
jgi:hypothetical protein